MPACDRFLTRVDPALPVRVRRGRRMGSDAQRGRVGEAVRPEPRPQNLVFVTTTRPAFHGTPLPEAVARLGGAP